MYDTVYFWIDRFLVDNFDLSTITACLEEISENISDRGVSIRGNLKNLKVGVYEGGVSVKGSLAKFHLGDNLQTLTRSGTQEAIEHLSDVLHLPMSQAKITGLDIATHFPMKYPPCYYYPLLGDKKYYKRLQATADSLYYNTRSKQLVFYDKSLEATAKEVSIPDVFQNTNLLRYEIRFRIRLAQQFNLPEISGETLYKDKFYAELIKRWAKEYMNIQKIKQLSIQNIDMIKTPDDAFKQICGVALLNAGQALIDTFISDLKAKNVFIDPKYYTRLKSKIKEVTNLPEISENSDLITELDQNVKQVRQYCR